MRPVSTAAQAVRERRTAIDEAHLLWIAARNRETGVPEALGLWSGPDDETIRVVDLFTGVEQDRLFYGAGALLSASSVRFEAGLKIRAMRFELSPLAPAVTQLFRVYEARGAQVQGWLRSYDPDTRRPVGVERWVKGYVNAAPITRPAAGGEASLSIDVVSTARMLTVASAVRKSSEALQARHPGDKFRKYKAVAGSTDVPWNLKGKRL